MEIEIEKVETTGVKRGEIRVGEYYRASSLSVWRRVQVRGSRQFFYLSGDGTVRELDLSCVSPQLVQPCDAAGNLLEPPGVAKVRIDTLKKCKACIDEDGNVLLLGDSSTTSIDCICIQKNGRILTDWVGKHRPVTPCTIKKIVVEMGGAG